MTAAPGRRGAIAFFVTFGVGLAVLAAALNIGWVVLTWSEVVPLLLGVTLFAAIITGLILNTMFLVREIRRNEQHDTFVNAVTHELKTPLTSIRLYLETLRVRSEQLDEAKRSEFYDLMLEDTARLQHTIDQVLRTGQITRAPLQTVRLDLRALVEESVALIRTRLHLPADVVRLTPAAAGAEAVAVVADEVELASAVMNLLDNAVKYSRDRIDVDVAVTREGERARVAVCDHGAGLLPCNERLVISHGLS